MRAPLVLLLLSAALAGCSGSAAGPNPAPVASAGPDRIIEVNREIIMDGSGSYDPDGEPITAQWTIVAAPQSSLATLTPAEGLTASFTTPDPGIWLIRLVVSDAHAVSAPAVVQVRATPRSCTGDMQCNDDNLCTNDTCDLVNHACVYTNNTGSCPDGKFCNGTDTCQDGQCQHSGDPCTGLGKVCDEDEGACIDCLQDDQCDDHNPCTADSCKSGSCTHLPESGSCDDGLFCNGSDTCQAGTCQHSGDPCLGQGKKCSETLQCVQCLVGSDCPDDQNPCTTSICDNGTCSTTNNTVPCDDGDFCTGTDTCDGSGGCTVHTGDPCLAQGKKCDPTGQKCGECLNDPDCDDHNACTQDTCSSGTCSHACTSADCMVLTAGDPVPVGGTLLFRIDMCPAGLPSSSFVCTSDRNNRGILADASFQTDFGLFSPTSGNVTLDSAADFPSYRHDGQGVKICDNEEGLTLALDSSGMYDLLVKFAAKNQSIASNNAMMFLDYTPDGISWTSLALFGDGVYPPYREYALLLPPDADNNPDLNVTFWTRSLNNGECGYIDDVEIMSLLPPATTHNLFSADFEGTPCTLAPFTISGTHPGDVTVSTVDASCRVRLTNKNGTAIVSPAIDTRAVNPDSTLVASWVWMYVGNHDQGHYVYAEFSTDGANWTQLAGTGHTEPPLDYLQFRAVLPCQAIGSDNLQVRMVSPETSANAGGDGVLIDDVHLDEVVPAWVDTFGSVYDIGGGIYTGTVTSSLEGSGTIVCRQGCATALWSNPDSITFTPN